MTDRDDPTGAAAIVATAAERVGALRRDDLAGTAGQSWNDAIDAAVAVLSQEAADIRAMAGMAHLLIVGNVHDEHGKTRAGRLCREGSGAPDKGDQGFTE